MGPHHFKQAAVQAQQHPSMANYDPNRPRPSIGATAALPGDALPAEPQRPLPSSHAPDAPDELPPSRAPDADDEPPSQPAPGSASGPDSDTDPAPAPASRLLPRQAEPVDRRWLAALGGAVAVGWVLAAALAWWLWRRRR